MILSRSPKGDTIYTKPSKMEDWDVSPEEFVKEFATPSIGEKKFAPYFLSGPTIGDKRRTKNSVVQADIVVLDCDKTEGFTGKEHKAIGAPPVEKALSILKEQEIAYLLYTTASHVPTTFNRYRIIFFLSQSVGAKGMKIWVEKLIRIFNEHGLPLAYAKETDKLIQPWFFPRIETKDSTYICEHDVTKEKKLLPVTKGDETEMSEIATSGSLIPDDVSGVPDAQQKGTNSAFDWTPINVFIRKNNNHAFFKAILLKHGYEQVEQDAFLAPQSGSGSAGVKLYEGDDGKWRVVSYHSEDHDPLALSNENNPHLALDAYHLYTQLEHKGDKDLALEVVMKTYPAWLTEEFLDRYVYLADSGHVGDLKTGEILQHFHDDLAPAWYVNEKRKTIYMTRVWRTQHERKRAAMIKWKPVTGSRFYKDEKGVSCWNPYNENVWEETDSTELVPKFLEHIDYLVDEESERGLVVQWLAERIQYPEMRARFHILHIAPHHRIGRGAVIRMISDIMGYNNCANIHMKDIVGPKADFNGFLFNARIGAIHEVADMPGSKHKIDSSTRSLLTEPTLLKHEKGIDKINMRLYMSFIFMSNQRDCISLPEEDGRIWVLGTENEKKEAEYYIHLNALIDNEQFLREVFWYLKRLDISELQKLTDAPNNDAKARLVWGTLSDTERQFKMMLKAGMGNVWSRELMRRYLGLYLPNIPGRVEKINDLVRANTTHAITQININKQNLSLVTCGIPPRNPRSNAELRLDFLRTQANVEALIKEAREEEAKNLKTSFINE